uniref:angiopoietin-related protein 7-like n=1 Tax=Anopheles coluzzii TaxID=1518534 RepID=UPI0020FF88CF|nr:angiopoietin-related protein 7-like [Anopheles coluzzii]
MIVCKTIVYVVVLVVFTVKVDGDEQNLTIPSFAGEEYHTKETSMEHLLLRTNEIEQKQCDVTETINNMLQNIEQIRESIDEKLALQAILSDRLQMTISQLGDMIGLNLTALQIQSNIAIKKVQETISQKMLHQQKLYEGLPASINQLSETLAQNLTALQSSTIMKDQESLDQKLSLLEKLSEELPSTINESVNQLRKTLDQNFTALQTQVNATIKQDRESTNEMLTEIAGTINQLIKTINHNYMTLETRLNKIQSEQNASKKYAQMQLEIQLQESKKDFKMLMLKSGFNLQGISFRSCGENPSKRSGKYLIQPSKNDEPFLGYCEQTAFGGGWLVIQYRYDGSVDFYRNWTEYRNGFGSVDGEFWLGLEYLYQLTSLRKHELLVELKDFNGNYKYARYSEFAISSEEEQYSLTKLGSYTGTAGDSLLYHKGKKFSTKDRDNDPWQTTDCANQCQGGWWYGFCAHTNLNGMRIDNVTEESMTWFHYNKSWQGMARSRMLIRET